MGIFSSPANSILFMYFPTANNFNPFFTDSTINLHMIFFTEVIITTTPPPTTTPTTEPTLAPLDLVATAATHNTVSLVWSSVPLTDASTVMYIVEYQKRGSNELWIVAVESLKANKYTVRRLEAGTSYVFNVKAVDQNGVILTQSSQKVVKKTHKKTVVAIGKL